MGDKDLQHYWNWLTQEHIADRKFLLRFLGVRLFTRLDNENVHFILHSTSKPSVLESEPYIKVLDNPSPWTEKNITALWCF